MKTILIIILSMALLTTVNAEGLDTGNDWLNQCRPENAPASLVYCYSYLQGVIEGSSAAVATLEEELKKSGIMKKDSILQFRLDYVKSFSLDCAPKELTIPQINRVFVKYLNENPESLHKTTAYLFTESMATTYPCMNTERKIDTEK